MGGADPGCELDSQKPAGATVLRLPAAGKRVTEAQASILETVRGFCLLLIKVMRTPAAFPWHAMTEGCRPADVTRSLQCLGKAIDTGAGNGLGRTAGPVWAE